MTENGRRPEADSQEPGARVRLQRLLADAGVAARRVCERLIEEGHVRVNGQVVTRLPVFVDPQADDIEVDGRRIPKPQRRIYIMLNKPAGTIVSAADEPGMDRPTVMDFVDHPSAGRLFPVGRLDFETTGLVLLTNDGEFANRLTHPRFGVPKTYQALVRGALNDEDVAAIGIKIRAIAQREAAEAGIAPRSISPPEVSIVRREADKTLLEITLKEARNRQLREVLRVLGIPVKKLSRIAIGPVRLKALAIGQWRELSREELTALRRGAAAGPRPKVAAGGARARRPRRSPSARPQSRNPRPHRADNHGRPPRKPTRGHRS